MLTFAVDKQISIVSIEISARQAIGKAMQMTKELEIKFSYWTFDFEANTKRLAHVMRRLQCTISCKSETVPRAVDV